MKAIGKRVIVTREAEPKPKSLIELPETNKEKPARGRVISVGDAGASEITSGEVVLFGKYAGTEVEVEGKPYLILNFDEILAVV